MRRVNMYIFVAMLVLISVNLSAKDRAKALPAAGEKLFVQHCAECHGRAAQGTDRAPALTAFVKRSEPAMLLSFIKDGRLKAGMPSWSRLPDQRLSQIVTYLQTLADAQAK